MDTLCKVCQQPERDHDGREAHRYVASHMPSPAIQESVKVTRARAAAVAARCNDAYSADRYRSWPSVALALLKAGYSEREAETIMRSKITRWADTGTHRYGHAPAHIVLPLAQEYVPLGSAELAEWVMHTLGPSQETD